MLTMDRTLTLKN